jgi:hypothetical protein
MPLWGARSVCPQAGSCVCMKRSNSFCEMKGVALRSDSRRQRKGIRVAVEAGSVLSVKTIK